MIGNIDTLNIPDKESLKLIIQEYVRILESTWVSILLNVPKHGGMRSVRSNCPITDSSRWLKIRIFSKKLSRRQNTYFLMIKFKKLPQKIIDHGTSWTRSKSVNCKLSKHCNTMVNSVSKSTILSRCYIKHSI